MTNLTTRPPVVAGQFYPGDPHMLRNKIRGYVNQAALPQDLGTVRAIIAPHAGYDFSGPTAGHAFKTLDSLPDKAWTVFLLGPAHRVYFRGVSLGTYSAFQTPLGEAPVDTDRVEELLNLSPIFTRTSEAHGPEHSLEVEIPFLQETLPSFRLVPMLYGDVDPREVAGILTDHIREDDLMVVSNDMSHFHAYAKAQRLDRSLLDALLTGDESSVLQGEACGRGPVATVMHLAEEKGWQPHLLDYRTSGDTAGDKFRVVGYAAVAYTSQ